MTISSANLNLLVFLLLWEIPVTLYRNPSNYRIVLGEFPDTSEVQKLIRLYDSGETAQISPKVLLNKYKELKRVAKSVSMTGVEVTI